MGIFFFIQLSNFILQSADYFRTNNLMDVFTGIQEGWSTGGIIPVAWFLFDYCLILLFAKHLKKIMNKYPLVFYLIVIIYTIIVGVGLLRFINYNKPHTLWLHLYLLAFLHGMVLSKATQFYSKSKTIYIVTVGLTPLTSYLYYRSIINNMVGPQMQYGTLQYSIWLINLFLLVAFFPYKIENKYIVRIAKNTFVVYMSHLYVLSFLERHFNIENTLTGAIITVLIVFLLTNMIAEIFKRIPLLRRIV